MTSASLLTKDDFESLKPPTQIKSFSSSSINHAFTDVAQEVAELLQQFHPFQADNSDRAEVMPYGRPETVLIRAIEPEYRQLITIEPLTARELEVLQLIVDGHNNSTIAEKLYITEGTVKTHVRNVLKKLYVSDRTQAAIRALRSGLVH
jgi:DNA-binding NarL/FixJ family response regulator